MPSLSPARKIPAAAAFTPEYVRTAAVHGYADEAPFGDIVKDPTPVPTTPPAKATDEATEGGEDASG